MRRFQVAYFAASADKEETNRRFAESLDLDYPILSDPERGVAKAYGVLGKLIGLPKRWTFYIGLDGKLLHVDRSINASTAGADIAAKLEELGVAIRD